MMIPEYDKEREIEKYKNTIRIQAEKEFRKKVREEVYRLMAKEGVSPEIIQSIREEIEKSDLKK